MAAFVRRPWIRAAILDPDRLPRFPPVQIVEVCLAHGSTGATVARLSDKQLTILALLHPDVFTSADPAIAHVTPATMCGGVATLVEYSVESSSDGRKVLLNVQKWQFVGAAGCRPFGAPVDCLKDAEIARHLAAQAALMAAAAAAAAATDPPNSGAIMNTEQAIDFVHDALAGPAPPRAGLGALDCFISPSQAAELAELLQLWVLAAAPTDLFLSQPGALTPPPPLSPCESVSWLNSQAVFSSSSSSDDDDDAAVEASEQPPATATPPLAPDSIVPATFVLASPVLFPLGSSGIQSTATPATMRSGGSWTAADGPGGSGYLASGSDLATPPRVAELDEPGQRSRLHRFVADYFGFLG